MTDFDTQRALQKNRVRRRGIFLLPNLLTTGALFDGFTREELSALLDKLAKNHKKGEVYWPLRVALSGLTASPDPVEIMTVLGKDETIKRIESAIKKLRL